MEIVLPDKDTNKESGSYGCLIRWKKKSDSKDQKVENKENGWANASSRENKEKSHWNKDSRGEKESVTNSSENWFGDEIGQYKGSSKLKVIVIQARNGGPKENEDDGKCKQSAT